MKKGTQHSEETKAKIAAAKLGKTFSKEHSQKISVALKGQIKTEEHKQAIAAGIRAANVRKNAVIVEQNEQGTTI